MKSETVEREITKNGYKVAVLPDIHVPRHDINALRSVFSFLKRNRWDEVIQLGDFLDLEQIAKFNVGNLRAVQGRDLWGDMLQGRRVLDRLLEASRTRNKRCRFTMLEGNHEQRIEKWIDAHPVAQGVFEIPKALEFEERKVQWVPRTRVYKIGHAHFIHGNSCGKNHTGAHLSRFGGNVFYGHTHSVEQGSASKWCKDHAIIAQSLGCLCEISMDYIQGQPRPWEHAIASFSFRKDGTFNYVVHRILNGQFTDPSTGVTYK
jgi:predicted phosphodiesterase